MTEHHSGLYRAVSLPCSSVRNLAFLKAFGKPGGASAGTVGGVAVSLHYAQLVQTLLAQAWAPLPELSISPCPRDTDLCPWHSPVKGTAPGSHVLPWEISVMSTLGLGLVGFSVMFILHQMVQERPQDSGYQHESRPWS